MHDAMPSGTPAPCANCGTALQGSYCHVCGQHGHNPLRSLRHAVEDVFESFWHLDGRVFRTLRDLAVPGRVACNYLDGQRVRYIPPLRLFVILTVITFFVGRLVTGMGADDIDAGFREGGGVRVQAGATNAGDSAFAAARTEAEVRAILDRQLADIARGRREAGNVPFMGVAMDRAEAEVRAEAERRIAALQAAATTRTGAAGAGMRADSPSPGTAAVPPSGATPAPAGANPPTHPTAPTSPPGRAAASGADAPAAGGSEDGVQGFVRAIGKDRLRDPARPWHETDNPMDVSWLPAFADRWFNHRLANLERNAERLDDDGGGSLFAQMVLAAVPSALFVLVPVFALLLKLFYVTTPRGYLEHLVVALYSHAFLLLVLLATFLLALLEDVVAAAKPVFVLLIAALWIWVPVYLLLMQRRVYRQHWALTVLKYLVIGFAYQLLITAATVYTVLAGLTSGA